MALESVEDMKGSNNYDELKNIPVITHEMLNKWRYYPLVVLSNTAMRTVVYPFTNITTKLQASKGNKVYTGLVDCFYQTMRKDGFRGFYQGGAVNIFGALPASLIYITTYERVRHYLLKHNPGYDHLCSGAAGLAASVVSQLIRNPVDIVSQTLILNTKGAEHTSPNKSIELLDISADEIKKHRGISRVTLICKCIRRQQGVLGLWKGYPASTLTYGVSSSLWWYFYHMYSDFLFSFTWMKETFNTIGIKAVAGVIGGMTTTCITNSLDLFRLRLQMQKNASWSAVLQQLHAEGHTVFVKALTPRIMNTCIFSFTAILGYESVKYLSLSEEYAIPL